ncbi:RNA ligase-domain-containing protein [Pyronema omphalodes]|nr:RNA ligase-domain-containing protein [Pyronema omphalodes]
MLFFEILDYPLMFLRNSYRNTRILRANGFRGLRLVPVARSSTPPSHPRTRSFTSSRYRLTKASDAQQQDPLRIMSSFDTKIVQQDPAEINHLVKILNDGEGNKDKKTFQCRKRTFELPGTGHSLDSWRIPEFSFRKSNLPTYGRGLFTWQDPTTKNYRIAIRGYDKFFNIDEVPRTHWRWIEDNTKGPYELNMKENGCIIFISGLPDGTLLVSSKHSLDSPHASVGEAWVEKQLTKIGKTKKELALTLYNANATAVAELCDDSFEEHVLAYEGNDAGLYLHGINKNLNRFATYRSAEIQSFADAWGFKKINVIMKDNVKDLRKFLEAVAETGSYGGREVEGFVIRCKARDTPDSTDWHDWFFKYKFEEPYLMYRQWREVTKAMLLGKQPTFKKQIEVTKEYLKFAEEYFKKNPDAKDEYLNNKGIIKLRNDFLNYRGMKGSDIIKAEQENEILEAPSKLLLVPVATIGCGKSTVAYALKTMFGWGHIQNDNIRSKKTKTLAFAQAIEKAFNESPVVFADRNNHQKHEREQLFRDIKLDGVRFVVLNYVHYSPEDPDLIEKIRNVTRSRVFSRGDNHQTIKATTKPEIEIQKIMQGFLQRFQEVNVKDENGPDRHFDLVINLSPLDDSRKNLEVVVKALHEAYPSLVPEIPSNEAFDSAIKSAFEDYYKPTPDATIENGPKKGAKKEPKQQQPQKANPTTQTDTPNNAQTQPMDTKTTKQKMNAIEYFQIKMPTDIIHNIVNEAINSAPPEKQEFWKKLQETNRVQRAFHVTLIHNSHAKSKADAWMKYCDAKVNKKTGESMGKATFKPETLVWDGRVMAIQGRIIGEWYCANEFPHITIGTADNTIKPVEANSMLVEKWKHGQGTEEISLTHNTESIDGTVQAVMRSHH